jgi:hypothetical protein
VFTSIENAGPGASFDESARAFPSFGDVTLCRLYALSSIDNKHHWLTFMGRPQWIF